MYTIITSGLQMVPAGTQVSNLTVSDGSSITTASGQTITILLF